jgi:hypothetical protein
MALIRSKSAMSARNRLVFTTSAKLQLAAYREKLDFVAAGCRVLRLGPHHAVTGTLTFSTWPRFAKTCLASASSPPSTSWVGCLDWVPTSHKDTHLEYVAEVGKDLPGLNLQPSLHQLGGVLRLGIPHQSQGHSP